MASMEEVNIQLNIAKAGFEQGTQLTLHGEGQAGLLYAALENMWEIVHGLQSNSLVTVAEGLAADVAAGHAAHSEAMDVLSGTFAGEDAAGLNPHIRSALTYGGQAAGHLSDSEQMDIKQPINVGEVRQRVTNISQHIGALFEELRLARNATRLAGMHVEKSTHRSIAARDEITAYQQEHDLEG